jgi:hypothetical protein
MRDTERKAAIAPAANRELVDLRGDLPARGPRDAHEVLLHGNALQYERRFAEAVARPRRR